MLELGKREYFWEKSCRIYIIFHSNESSQNPLGPSPTSTHAFDISLQESQQKHCQAATCEHVHVQSLIPSVWWKTKRDGDSFAVSATGCEKKKKSQNHKNHKIQTAAHWLNYVNHSPKRSRWSILVWNPIRTHTFLKKTATTQLLLSNWKLQAILSMKKWLQVVHLYTVFRQMRLVLKPKNLPFQLHVEIMACFFQHTL